ncbi:MAG: hypothetical protein HC859_12670 [Bacteroidia bacterium]|nr:hypothetical protein [Bacteroidia bacterium]
MSKTQKIVLGILTLVPFVLVPYFLFQVFLFVMEMVRHGDQQPEPAMIVAGVFSFVFPIIVTGVLSLGLLIFYIIHALNNQAVSSSERVIWILIFIFIGTIGFPIYWVMRIWSDETKTTLS